MGEQDTRKRCGCGMKVPEEKARVLNLGAAEAQLGRRATIGDLDQLVVCFHCWLAMRIAMVVEVLEQAAIAGDINAVAVNFMKFFQVAADKARSEKRPVKPADLEGPLKKVGAPVELAGRILSALDRARTIEFGRVKKALEEEAVRREERRREAEVRREAEAQVRRGQQALQRIGMRPEAAPVRQTTPSLSVPLAEIAGTVSIELADPSDEDGADILTFTPPAPPPEAKAKRRAKKGEAKAKRRRAANDDE